MNVDVQESGQACGAVVTAVDLTRPVDADTVAEIRSAWLRHKVLVFVNQPMSDDDLERNASYFGPFGTDPFFEPIDGFEHVCAIHRKADETAPIFAESWHSDWSFLAHPPSGTCLFAKIVPPTGGDTLFADQHKALAAMPSELRERCEGLLAIHSARGAYSKQGLYGEADKGNKRAMRIVVGDEALAARSHPFIRVHPETGEPGLFGCAGYIIGFEGMAQGQANDLARELLMWQTRDEFVYRHSWEPNMLVMWDNRSILHMATGGYDGHERLLHRVTIGSY